MGFTVLKGLSSFNYHMGPRWPKDDILTPKCLLGSKADKLWGAMLDILRNAK